MVADSVDSGGLLVSGSGRTFDGSDLEVGRGERGGKLVLLDTGGDVDDYERRAMWISQQAQKLNLSLEAGTSALS